MKKVFIAAIAVGLLSTTVFAGWVSGTVDKIQKIPAGTYVTLKQANNATAFAKITLTGDARKEFIAVLLTAKAQNATIKLYARSGEWVYYDF